MLDHMERDIFSRSCNSAASIFSHEYLGRQNRYSPPSMNALSGLNRVGDKFQAFVPSPSKYCFPRLTCQCLLLMSDCRLSPLIASIGDANCTSSTGTSRRLTTPASAISLSPSKPTGPWHKGLLQCPCVSPCPSRPTHLSGSPTQHIYASHHLPVSTRSPTKRRLFPHTWLAPPGPVSPVPLGGCRCVAIAQTCSGSGDADVRRLEGRRHSLTRKGYPAGTAARSCRPAPGLGAPRRLLPGRRCTG